MRTFYFTLCLLAVAITALSQDLKKVKNTNDRVRTAQVFYVLKDKPNIKQGDFTYRYKGKTQIQGQFDQNIQVGEWKYFPNKNLVVEGNYKAGKKDGQWKYFQNNHLISVMNYEDGYLHGECLGYYENGKLASKLNYLNGKYNGTRISYFEDGSIKELMEYQNGIVQGKHQKYNNTGVLLFEVDYKNGVPYNLMVDSQNIKESLFGGDLKNGTGEFVRYTKSNDQKIMVSKANYLDGKLHGAIMLYDRKGELAIRGQYMDGYMIGMWEFNINKPEKKHAKVFSNKDQLTTCPELSNYMNYLESLFHSVSTMPKFDDGDSRNFQEHIILSMEYPTEAEKKGIEGRVLTRFKVNQFGMLTDFEILEGSHELLNKEAERVIRTSPLWSPGFSDQIPVDVQYVFPIIFQL